MRLYELNECKASSLGDYLPNLLGLDPEERIVYFVVTDNYAGHLLFAFENGKIARIPLQSYATKTNRKKLVSAYSDISPLVDVLYINGETELAVSSTNDRILVVATDQIPTKTTKSSQGVQVLKCKKGCKLKYMKKVAEAGFADPAVYRTKTIPVAGSFMKNADKPVQQLTLL